MRNTSVLVTGANGLIGHHVCRLLLDGGARVVSLTRSASPRLLEPFRGHPRLTVLRGNICDREFAGELFRREPVDGVIHLAVERYFPSPGEKPVPLEETSAYRTNYTGTRNLLQAARDKGVRAWVQGSAMMVYDIENITVLPVPESHPPAPVEINGLSVCLAESLCSFIARTSRMKVVILRFPGVYGWGKSSGAIAKFVRHCLRESGQSLAAPADRSADFLYAEDAAVAALLALKSRLPAAEVPPQSLTHTQSPHIYHIGSGRDIAIADLARLIGRLSGSQVNIVETRSGNPRRFFLDISAARRELGYAPRKLEDGLAAYIRRVKSESEALS